MKCYTIDRELVNEGSRILNMNESKHSNIVQKTFFTIEIFKQRLLNTDLLIKGNN